MGNLQDRPALPRPRGQRLAHPGIPDRLVLQRGELVFSLLFSTLLIRHFPPAAICGYKRVKLPGAALSYNMNL